MLPGNIWPFRNTFIHNYLYKLTIFNPQLQPNDVFIHDATAVMSRRRFGMIVDGEVGELRPFLFRYPV